MTDTHDAVSSWEHFLPLFRDHLEELPVLLPMPYACLPLSSTCSECLVPPL